jgi:exopolysaccharide biosynthesis polyprenyl glycosylphosphotransferase
MRVHSERMFDLAASFGLLLLASPLMLLTALAIKIEDGLSAPVFYGQDRVGYAGKLFRVLKFRSMRVDAERDGKAQWATTNDNRVTALGKYLRKLRIDELPQLLNVLRGEMSFVGPRPERPFFVEQLSQQIPFYQQRHAVKPGLTGWAQVKYRYGSSLEDAMEKLRYDLYYIKHLSVFFDLTIVFDTVKVVLFRKGAA